MSLLRALQRSAVRTMVFSSSATVYGEPLSVPIREDFPVSTQNPYGASKLMMEQVLADIDAAEPGAWRIARLRYFNPVGAHESGLIGEDPRDIPNNLLPYVAQVAAGLRERGRPASVLEMVRAFERASGRAVPYDIVPRRPGDVAQCWADPALAEKLLGWRARHGIDRMCDDAWRWQSGTAAALQD